MLELANNLARLSFVREFLRLLGGVFVTGTLFSTAAYAEINAVTNPMIAGLDGYSVYRIPGFAVADDGSLMLFAEGRPSGLDPGGPGDIDIVYKRSTDGGQTWSALSVLHTDSGFDYSDPRVVVDQNTGTAHLQYVQWPTLCGQTCVPTGLGSNSALIYHQTSADNGATWSDGVDISSQVKDPNWASINTGPGIGIQLKWQDSAPARNGRLLMPAHRRPPAYEGVSLYSDNGGATWTYGSGATPHFSDESEVIELTNGDLLWDARRGGPGRNRSISHDGGDTWVDHHNGDIPISAVDGALVRYSAQREGDDRDRILFSGPLGTPAGAGNGRDNIGVWSSYDEGQTFINPVQIQSGSAAYSVLDKLHDGTIGLIYEVNHNTVRYVNFDLAELEKATHSASMSHYDGFGNQIDAFRGGVGWSGAWNNSGVTTVQGALEFAGYLTEGDTQHAHLRGADMNRNFGHGSLDLNQNQDYFLSLFINHDSVDGTDDGSGEFLDILLQDGTGTTQAAFGVGSSENFFVTNLGSTVDSGGDALALDTSYLMLVKLSAQDDSSGSNFDQLFLAWYDDPAQVPADEAQINWQLVGDTSENLAGTIERISIAGGNNADWLVDGLRIGTSLDAVIVDTGISLLGDLTGDSMINLADWIEFKGNYGMDTSALAANLQLREGDFDTNGRVEFEDFIAFRDLYNEVNGIGAYAAALAQVPEPNSFGLLVLSVLLTHCASDNQRPSKRHSKSK